MSEPKTTTVDVNGHPCRVWTKGSGPKIGFLAGFGGLPRWIPFLDRLAEHRTVIVPSMPGFPGATGHNVLDTHLDWLVAVRTLLVNAGLDGADLVGSSVGGSFVAEIAALWPQSVRRIAMIAPFGLFDEKDPAADVWAAPSPGLPRTTPPRPPKPPKTVSRFSGKVVAVNHADKTLTVQVMETVIVQSPYHTAWLTHHQLRLLDANDIKDPARRARRSVGGRARALSAAPLHLVEAHPERRGRVRQP